MCSASFDDEVLVLVLVVIEMLVDVVMVVLLDEVTVEDEELM